MAATLKQIAQASDVSIQTASRVIRGDHGRHDPQTVARVLQAAKALNYRPNLLGRALKSGRTHTLGVMRLGVGNNFQLRNIHGMAERAVELGYQLLTTFENRWRNDHDKTFLQSLDELVGRQVDGLAIVRGLPLEPATCRRLRSLPIPVLWTDWAPATGAHRIRRDADAALDLVLEHLHTLGHRSIAYFHSPGALHFPGQNIHRVERAAHRWGMQAQIVAPDPGFDFNTPEEIWSDESIRRFLRHRPRKGGPTALITGAYEGVATISFAVRQAGLRMPQDLSLVSLNPSPWCEIMDPPVTCLEVNSEALGRSTIQRLCELIDQPEPGPSDMLIPIALRQRGSTGPAGARGLRARAGKSAVSSSRLAN